jgi:hypothetical protein
MEEVAPSSRAPWMQNCPASAKQLYAFEFSADLKPGRDVFRLAVKPP